MMMRANYPVEAVEVCAGQDPEVWHPDHHDAETYRVATDLCHICPVEEWCGQVAMVMEEGKPLKERHGVFGGLTPKERFEKAANTEADRSPVWSAA